MWNCGCINPLDISVVPFTEEKTTEKEGQFRIQICGREEILIRKRVQQRGATFQSFRCFRAIWRYVTDFLTRN